MGENEGFLDRWSRRKLAEKEQETEQEVASLPAAADAEHAHEEGAAAEPPERHPAEDIDLESLSRDSDFSIFLQKGVPAAIKQKALRKLWLLDPVLSAPEKHTDMFNIADTKTWGLGPVRGTSWRVGEGYSWRDVLPETAEATPEEAPESQETVAEAEPEEPAEPANEDLPAHDDDTDDHVAEAAAPAAAVEDESKA